MVSKHLLILIIVQIIHSVYSHNCSSANCTQTINPVCPTGYSLKNGTCVQVTDPVCPVGYSYHKNGTCYRTRIICPAGTRYVNGKCECVSQCNRECQDGYTLLNNMCHQNRPLPCGNQCATQESPVIQATWSCPDRIVNNNCASSSESCNSISCPLDITNVVHNNNIVKSPVVVHVNNVNTIHVYDNDKTISTNCQDNNCTTNVITTSSTTTPRSIITTTTSKEPCCIIVTPRICRRYRNRWQCFNRRYSRCGRFCTRPVIYLKPRRIIHHPPIIVMPPVSPPVPFCNGSGCDSDYTDCSGCMTYGNCSPTCYEYYCPENSCDYHDQTSFCEEFGGSGCNKMDGCFGGDCLD